MDNTRKEMNLMRITMKQARVGADMTQQQVADRLGVHVQTYQRMENNPEDISIKQGKNFADIVGVNFEDICFGKHSN